MNAQQRRSESVQPSGRQVSVAPDTTATREYATSVGFGAKRTPSPQNTFVVPKRDDGDFTDERLERVPWDVTKGEARATFVAADGFYFRGSDHLNFRHGCFNSSVNEECIKKYIRGGNQKLAKQLFDPKSRSPSQDPKADKQTRERSETGETFSDEDITAGELSTPHIFSVVPQKRDKSETGEPLDTTSPSTVTKRRVFGGFDGENSFTSVNNPKNDIDPRFFQPTPSPPPFEPMDKALRSEMVLEQSEALIQSQEGQRRRNVSSETIRAVKDFEEIARLDKRRDAVAKIVVANMKKAAAQAKPYEDGDDDANSEAETKIERPARYNMVNTSCEYLRRGPAWEQYKKELKELRPPPARGPGGRFKNSTALHPAGPVGVTKSH